MVAGHPGAHDRYPFTFAHEARFCFKLSFTLVAQKAGVQIDCQGKAFPTFCIFSG